MSKKERETTLRIVSLQELGKKFRIGNWLIFCLVLLFLSESLYTDMSYTLIVQLTNFYQKLTNH